MNSFEKLKLFEIADKFEKAAAVPNSRDKQDSALTNLIEKFEQKTNKKFVGCINSCKRFFDFWIMILIRKNFSKIRAYTIPVKMSHIILWVQKFKNINFSNADLSYLRKYAKSAARLIMGDIEHLHAKQADPLTFENGIKLINEMRFNSPVRSEINGKRSALLILLTLLTGSRIGDLLKIKWNDIKISKDHEGRPTLTIYVVQKTDLLGKNRDRKTIILPSNKNLNPIFWLFEESKYKGAYDYLFLGNNNKLLTGDKIRYQMRKAAERLNLDFTPTGHSCRTALCSTLSLANVSDERIRYFLNWKEDSDMPKLYKRSLLEKSDYGCAKTIFDLIEDNKIFALQKQIDRN